MKRLLIFVTALQFLMACNPAGKETGKEELLTAENLTKEQAASLIEKDSIISSFVSSFNEIQDNLDKVKETQKNISLTNNAELGGSQKDRIIADISMMQELMQKNKDRIETLRKRIKNSNQKNDELEKMISRLTMQVMERDDQIAMLTEELSKANTDFKDLLTKYDTQTEELGDKTVKVNTAYYAYGTSKELIKNKVLTKEGGFIGIGKTKQLAGNFNKEYFTKIDIRELNKIDLNVKKAKLITSHPSSSYKLNMNGKMVASIEITNQEDFWSSSKYLVIIVD